MPCDAKPVNYRTKPGGSTKLVTPAGDDVCQLPRIPARRVVAEGQLVRRQCGDVLRRYPDTVHELGPLEVMERYKNKAIVFIPKRDTWTW